MEDSIRNMRAFIDQLTRSLNQMEQQWERKQRKRDASPIRAPNPSPVREPSTSPCAMRSLSRSPSRVPRSVKQLTYAQTCPGMGFAVANERNEDGFELAILWAGDTKRRWL
jgi:hypothetical protein